jgi:hypothetical protein
MKSIPCILFWLCVTVAVGYSAWLARSYHLRALGIDLIQQGKLDRLESIVRGSPGLATQLLGYTYQANRKDLFEMLLAHGANVNRAQLQTQWGPYPLLHHFAREENIYWLKSSFNHGGDANARSRFGITPLSEALDSRRAANAMMAIEWGADIHGEIQGQPFYDLAVEALLFEPAYRMLEMGVDPDGTLNQFPNAVHILKNCCTGVGLAEETIRDARENVWFQKILTWYRERDIDIENARYEPGGENQPGKWRIPSFSEQKLEIKTRP